MKPSVLFLHQWFWPEITAVSQMLTDLIEDLMDSGFSVTVVTSRTNLLAKVSDLPRLETYKGAWVIRTYATSFGRRKNVLRLVDFATFWVSSLWSALRLPRHDIVVALTTPPFIIFAGLAVKCLKGSRCLYWVQDLYPDVAVKFGMFRYSLVRRALEAASRIAFRLADAIVPISPQMGRIIMSKGVAPEKVHVIENWACGEEIYPLKRAKNWFLSSYGLEHRFIVQYSGNMGSVHEIGTILEAANRLRHETEIVFVFIGDGPRRGEIVEYVARNGLSNVVLLPYQPRADLLYSLNAADVGLVSLLPSVDGLVLPSKLYGVLAAGKPVIAICDEHSELGSIVKECGCGEAIPIGHVGGLVDVIKKYKCDSGLVARVGEIARRTFETRWERKVGTARFRSLILEMAQSNS